MWNKRIEGASQLLNYNKHLQEVGVHEGEKSQIQSPVLSAGPRGVLHLKAQGRCPASYTAPHGHGGVARLQTCTETPCSPHVTPSLENIRLHATFTDAKCSKLAISQFPFSPPKGWATHSQCIKVLPHHTLPQQSVQPSVIVFQTTVLKACCFLNYFVHIWLLSTTQACQKFAVV